MQTNGTIRYLPHGSIDKTLWDRCIAAAPNGLIYANTFYLDAMADNWDALVLNDYEAVMPLPWRKKYGIRYIYQPFLTAQLGLFGQQLDAALLRDFLDAIPAKFRLWEFSLNHGNLFAVGGYALVQRMNYVLDLSASYETLWANYREQTRRNIRKSQNYGCAVKKNTAVSEVLALAKEQGPGFSERDAQHFLSLYQLLHNRGMARTYGVHDKLGRLVASCVFFFSQGRAYYILVGNHPDGRTLGASHALIDSFIRDHAGTGLLLDFEGSDLRNLAFFYSSFGAQQEPYAAIRQNRLPFYLKWRK